MDIVELSQMSDVELQRYARKQRIKKSDVKRNKSWSEDSEIEIKTPISTLKRSGTFSVEAPVTPMEKQPKLDDASEMSLAKNQSHKRRRAASKREPITTDPMKNSVAANDKENEKISKEKQPKLDDASEMSLAKNQSHKRRRAASKREPITTDPMKNSVATNDKENEKISKEKQPKLDDASEMSLAKNQYHKRRRAASKREPITTEPMKNSVATNDKENEKISKDEIFAVCGHQLEVTLPKTARKIILRHDKGSYSGKKSTVCTKNSRQAKSNGNKVNFITPDRQILRRSSSASVTPLKSVKDRPKTPVAVRNSLKRKSISSPSTEKSTKIVRMRNDQFTPKLLNGTFSETSVSFATGTKSGNEITMLPVSAKKSSTSEMSKIQTPDFKEIHKRAFDKMETLEEYCERKKNRIHNITKNREILTNEILNTQLEYSPKKGTSQKKKQKSIAKFLWKKAESAAVKPSQIPQQPSRVIPFIPLVKSIRKINTNFSDQASSGNLLHSSVKKVADVDDNPSKKCHRILFPSGHTSAVFQFSKAQITENYSSAVSENKKRFDLKSSLAKKLPYKPYKGAVKPLGDSNSNSVKSSYVDPIKEKRAQSREILKGVRKNRRFELQMSRRGIV